MSTESLLYGCPVVLIDWKAVHLFRTSPHGVFFHKQEVFLRPQKVAALGFSRTWELQTELECKWVGAVRLLQDYITGEYRMCATLLLRRQPQAQFLWGPQAATWGSVQDPSGLCTN